MAAKKRNSILSILLIVFLFANLLNVQVARADGETPTEPPAATEVVTEPPVESTPEPVEATPAPASSVTSEPVASQQPTVAESTPVAGILADAPEDTNLVVLDEQGQPVALGSQETADAIVESDPVWCPAGVNPPTPGANGCSDSFPSITELLTAMRNSPSDFDQNGTIYLEVLTSPGFTTPLILDDSAGSLSSSFATLSAYDLTVRGGWNPGTGTVTGSQALFGVSGANQGYILIGSLTNPWVGNVKLQDIEVRDVTATNSITIYTSSGDIIFDDVDVAEQAGDHYQVYLRSLSGDINVGNGSNYDGNDTGTTNESRGFYAETGTGSISITGTSSAYTFRDNEGAGADAHNGATLLAPTVTLNNVISRANDGNGIVIANANLVTLNNVTSSVNTAGGFGNGLSGVYIQGTGSTIVNLHGGTFAKNGRYGIELFGGTLVMHSAPTCPTTNPTANGLGCFNVTPVSPTEPTPTEPTPTEPTPTQPTPTEPTPTQPTPTESTPVPPTPAPTQASPTAPATGTSTSGSSTSTSSGSGSTVQNAVIPLTGGGLVDLNCNSVFWAGGIKLSFMNLCDHQTQIEGVGSDELPGDLPAGFSYVAGLDVSVLADGEPLEALPDGAGIQMDFPIGADGEYAVLYWDADNGQWIEVAQELNSDEVSDALNGSDGEGLYQLVDNVADLFLQILTTDKTGIFVMVQK